ncbi:hypothetical protein BD769DRAFT_1501020 [Suillus cothurnatus]|nr:hypothetical protein BD769DRAFT_1501020 [Suillus cothurnatus]
MWLIEGHDSSANDQYRGSDAEENEHDLGTQIAKEVAALKRPKVEKPSVEIANCLTNTQCGTSACMSSISSTYPDCLDPLIFMSRKPPVDPVKLVMKHVENVQETGVTRTKYKHRLTPV